MSITSGANAKSCTVKSLIWDKLLFWLHFRFITAIDCDHCSQITVGYATQSKAILSTAKIFAV